MYNEVMYSLMNYFITDEHLNNEPFISFCFSQVFNLFNDSNLTDAQVYKFLCSQTIICINLKIARFLGAFKLFRSIMLIYLIFFLYIYK